jgi:hypothetical protein
MKKITVKIVFVTALVIGFAAVKNAQTTRVDALAGKIKRSVKVNKSIRKASLNYSGNETAKNTPVQISACTNQSRRRNESLKFKKAASPVES